jgi:hypothetical protein
MQELLGLLWFGVGSALAAMLGVSYECDDA